MSLVYAFECLFSEKGSVGFTRISNGYKTQRFQNACIEEMRFR